MSVKTKIKLNEANTIGDIQKIGNEIAARIAAKARNELTAAYQEGLDDYYSYPKGRYKRTWEFYKRSYTRYYRNPHGVKARGGVVVGTGRMKETHSRSNRILFPWVVEEGAHGNPDFFRTARTTPPIEFVYRKFDEITESNSSISDWAKDCVSSVL